LAVAVVVVDAVEDAVEVVAEVIIIPVEEAPPMTFEVEADMLPFDIDIDIDMELTAETVELAVVPSTPSPVMYAGAGFAVEGSTSAPIPQGIAECVASGWTEFAGAVTAPVVEAIANRVVHCKAFGSVE
jgi:hypothetical protein